MNETTNLACKFKDSQGQSHSINVDSLADNLLFEKITDFMQYVIDSEVLVINET